jgi:hypothetical protein
MNIWRASAVACALLLGGAAPTHPPVLEDPAIDAITAPDLQTFASESDFLAYLRAVKRLGRERGYWWAEGRGRRYAQNEFCPPDQICEEEPDQEISVTGSRLPAAPRAAAPAMQVAADAANAQPGTITNTQKIGVDEGDIVKQIGHFLIVLQDGRLFVVDMRPGGTPGLALVDRADVYRDRRSAASWYDEMLVHENRIVVAAYNYREGGTEIAVFTLSQAGALAHEATYVLSSDDYYDVENYATRLVNDRLIVYTPLHLQYVNPDKPLEWPVIRRWMSDEESEGAAKRGRRLFDARSIYRPIQRTLEPVVHTVSVCPLGSARSGDELDCSTTAFVGPPDREFYVSRTHAYLWVAPGYDERETGTTGAACKSQATFAEALPSALFQVPLDGSAPRALRVRGEPNNQFALETSDQEFRALLIWESTRCAAPEDDVALKYFSTPLSSFRAGISATSERRYVDAPSPGNPRFENRFTDEFVVYGGRSHWAGYPPGEYDYGDEDEDGDGGEEGASARVIAIPVARPRSPSILAAPHNIVRLERAGNDIVLTGYKDEQGLSVSLVDLSARPRVAGTTILDGRYESEGRSHAFNSLIEQDGSGLMGLPTVERIRQSGRWWWRSRASDVSFLEVDAEGAVSSIGALRAHEKSTHEDYSCEVSCIDWYGNTRPIFTDGRIFGLSGTELIEGVFADRAIQERRRINLTGPPASRRRKTS